MIKQVFDKLFHGDDGPDIDGYHSGYRNNGKNRLYRHYVDFRKFAPFQPDFDEGIWFSDDACFDAEGSYETVQTFFYVYTILYTFLRVKL